MFSRVLPQAAACLFAAILTGCVAGPEHSDQKGVELIAQARAATGGDAWDRIEIWHETGSVTSPSTGTTRYEHWHDAHSLSIRNVTTDVSGATRYMLFDGRESYQATDAQFHDRMPLDLNGVRNGAYLVAFGFFFPARFAASVTYRGLKSEKGVAFDVVTVIPEGLEPVDIWLDRNTHRIFRLVSSGGRSHEDLSDYREVGGVLVPFNTAINGTTTAITDTVRFEPRDSVRFSP